MPMYQYLIAFVDAIPKEVWQEAIQENDILTDDGVYELSNQILIVNTTNDDPQVVGNALGLSEEGTPSRLGVVFRLNGSYAGYHYKGLWEWLAKSRESK